MQNIDLKYDIPKKFTIDIEPEALDDIQKAIDYYNTCKPGLGKRFYNTVDKHLKFLQKNYMSFALRYDDIRCMKIERLKNNLFLFNN
jgi:toxin ParE1/3/4